MEPVVLEGFDIAVERAEVLRFLNGAANADRQPTERVERVLAEAMTAAGGMIAPKGIYAIVPGNELPGSTLFKDLERVAFCVCTIGPALEREVSRRSGAGDLLGAVVLDTVGSVAAEAAAEYLDRVIQELAGRVRELEAQAEA